MERESEFERRQEDEAAAEAARIGAEPGRTPGRDDDLIPPGESDDPAMRAVEEAGGGEAEGFEAAEEELIDNASHGGGRGDPIRDAITPEVEADESTAVEGEADEIIESDDRD